MTGYDWLDAVIFYGALFGSAVPLGVAEYLRRRRMTRPDQKTHVQELMDSRAPGDMPTPLEFREASDADQKKG